MQPFVIIALIGFIMAVIFLGVPPFYSWSVKRQARKEITMTRGDIPMSDANPLPAAFVATQTIEVDGKKIPVREIERSRAYHCSVFTGADGSVYLEYEVSVGPFKTEIFVMSKSGFPRSSPTASYRTPPH